MSPDLALLQEVKHTTVDDITEHLHNNGYPHSTYSGESFDTQKRYGNIIASRWPISPFARGWAHDLRWPQLVHRATVHAPDGDIDVLNAHIPNGSGNGWDKVYTLEAIAKEIASSVDMPRVLAGDFNEPQTILPNGEIISWGQLIAPDGSIRFGRRSRGGAKPGWFTDKEGRTHDLTRWHAAVTRIFDTHNDIGLHHVRNAINAASTVLPVTHVIHGNNRFFDHIFTSKHFTITDIQYIDTVRENNRYSDHSAVCADVQWVN